MGHRGPADWATSGALAPAAPPPWLAPEDGEGCLGGSSFPRPCPLSSPARVPPRSSGGPSAWGALGWLGWRLQLPPGVRVTPLGWVPPSVCQTVVGWDRFPSSDLPDLRIPGGYGQLHSVVRPCAGSEMPQFSASKASAVFRSWKTPSSYIRSTYVYRARTVSQVVFLGVGARAVTEREKSLTLTELPIYSKKGN